MIARPASLRMLLPWLCATLLLVTIASRAAAQSRPTLRASVQPTVVEVGQVFAFKLTALVAVSDRVPDHPALTLPPGFVLRSGPQILPQTQVSITGAGILQAMGIEASWQVEARAAGQHNLGPASVVWQGKRFDSGRVQLKVHPSGTLPRRQDPFDLFDIFGLPKMPSFPDLQPPDVEQALPPTDPALAMAIPADRIVFLRALVDKDNAVLGEQVTLSVFEYTQGGSPRQVEAREPAASDFLQKALLAPDDEPAVRFAEVGSEIWKARLIRRIALFPLKTGDLSIGPMEVKFVGPGLRGPTVRRSGKVVVRVHDAPEQGRPIGFRPGDVGQFSLSADVAPRTVEQGGSVAVTVKLEGVGNLPMALQVPRRKGVDWLDPTTRERFDVSGDDRVRGLRTFTYVVRLSEAATVDLGAVELPFYDPWRKSYEVASAPLGSVSVTPSARPAASMPDAPDRFAALGPVRKDLGAAPIARAVLSDRPLFWAALAAGPLCVLLLGAAARASQRVRDRFVSWRSSLDRHAALALEDARRAAASGSLNDAVAAIERAVHTGVQAATGLKSRGVLREELSGELQTRGCSAPLAGRVVDLLARCEEARFDPGTRAEVVNDMVDEARALLRELPRGADERKAST